MVSIRPYVPEQDTAATFALWRATLDGEWPLDADVFRRVLTSAPPYRAGDHFVAEADGRVIGFVATQAQQLPLIPDREGSIMVLLVAPDRQRQGLGRALQEQAVQHLRGRGLRRAQVGGRVPRFWPGVPNTLPQALAFWQACGWQFTATAYDLVQPLRDYQTPPGILEPVAAQGVRLDTATEADRPALLAFQDREFPNWTEEYRYVAAFGDDRDFLLAWDRDGTLLGSLLLYSPQSHAERGDLPWRGPLLGPDAGILSAVGVAQAARKRGIGLALVARGSELLQERGTGTGHIGWTGLVDFYGKVGYQPWHAYAMGWRDL